MNTRPAIAAFGFGMMMLLGPATAAQPAEVKVIAANAMRGVVEDLGPQFERASGNKLAVTFAPIGAIMKRVRAGEAADVVIVDPQGADGLVKDGKANAADVTVLARSFMGVAVRQGAARPDISSPEAFKRALLAAKSITYPNPAKGSAGGVHVATVLDRLGIADQMKPKTVFGTPPDLAVDVVAKGMAELGIQQLHELIAAPGLDIVGPLPGDLQSAIVFAAAIMSDAKQAQAARAFVQFLRTPDAAAAIKAKGMEPAAPR
jgi:molybdate transport system substrate-binding protein